MKFTDETVVNLAVASIAILALVVQAGAHLLVPASSAGSLSPVDASAHDLLIGCIGFLARSVVRAPSPSVQAAA